MHTPSPLASCTLFVFFWFPFPCSIVAVVLVLFCTLFFYLHGCQVAAEGQQDQLVLQRPVKSSSHHSSRHRNRDRERDRDRDRDRDRNRERGHERERARDNTWPVEKHTNVQPQARNWWLFFCNSIYFLLIIFCNFYNSDSWKQGLTHKHYIRFTISSVFIYL